MVMQRFLYCILWAFSALASTSAKPDVTPFKNLPDRIFYFEDTTVVLYHDPAARNVYISEDEGKSWKPASGIPEQEAAVFVEHPFDNRMAFIMTIGKKHYKTTNRGKLWQSFEVPADLSNRPKPLAFHADKSKGDYILYRGMVCKGAFLWSRTCEEQTYYTFDGFASSKLLLNRTTHCTWAHSTKEIPVATNANLIFCVAFDKSAVENGGLSVSSSRLFSSEDFFQNEKKIVDFGLPNPKASRGVIGLGVVSKFLIAAVKDVTSDPTGVNAQMNLYVSLDGHSWGHAKFPHASTSKLFENAYTIVEGTAHSLAVDVLNHPSSAIGTLFMSNSNGTFFTQSLQNTNRNEFDYVDFEGIYGVEGVGLANIVANVEEVEHLPRPKKIKSLITFDDGRSWNPISPPSHDASNKCPGEECTLHLYSVSTPHNIGRVFSTPAPGFVLGVGSVGSHLAPYDECDTFLSTDAGVSWKMVRRGAHKYEIGDKGSIMVLADDEEPTDFVSYSWNNGKTWDKYELGTRLRVRLLTTVPDSTSQKFILLGTLPRQDASVNEKRHAVVFLDFATMNKRRCTQDDMEKWMARTAKGKECLMGHKQWYWRRKVNADCYVGDKFKDPEEHEENCPCEEDDYECDYNYVLQNGKCFAAGPEPIGPGICKGESSNEKYLGSSGYRLIPGNTCTKKGGLVLDNPLEKDCSQAQPPEGNVTHQIFEFPNEVTGHWWFRDSKTILVHLRDGQVWQSANEGYSWAQPRPGEVILAVYHNAYANDRAYLIGKDKMFLTIDQGRIWTELPLPLPPNIFRISIIHTHPDQSDWLIYIGSEDCETSSGNCKAVAFYSTDHAQHWHRFESYVSKCGWARDRKLKVDKELIICESHRDKKGSQLSFRDANPLELWNGANFYKNKKKLFGRVVGYAQFSEYLLVGEVGANSLDLQVSLDGLHYSKSLFPPSMRLDNHAYTILESSTDAVFLHLTISDKEGAEWGNLLKSNSNGTYYGLSLEYANRNHMGYVDFEKMIGLDGIALMNVVANPTEAAVTGKKKLQTRITHNDGGSWKSMTPPASDSLGQPYKCNSVGCALHIHGFTERIDARATYSSPSAIGLMMAVGNVGEHLADYKDSDTFLTRDGGFTWEEIRKDAHMYEFGDSGSVLVLVNDEGPTDRVLYSKDEGLAWKEYLIGQSIRVASIVTMTRETSRKFILFGHTSSGTSVAVHLDFSAITTRPCVLKVEDSVHDDFELWSPSEEREERCLFGRQTLYHRRLRTSDCYVGDQAKDTKTIKKNCECIESDFECEFNHIRNGAGECVLVEGATPLSTNMEEMCFEDPNLDYWFERTAYRKIPYSSCERGLRLDHGAPHSCGGVRGRSAMFWLSVFFLPFAITGFVAYYYRRGGYRRGTIRLPDSSRDAFEQGGVLSTIASIPWFVMGMAAISWSAIINAPIWQHSVFQGGRGYRHVPIDEDARDLRFDDED